MRTAESVVLTDWPPGPGRAVDVDLEVVRVDGHLDLVGLGQDGHRGRRGVDPALGLGDRHPLDPVRAGLVLEPAPGVSPLTTKTTSLSPSRSDGALGEHLDLPARAARRSGCTCRRGPGRRGWPPRRPRRPRISTMTLRPSLGSLGRSRSRSWASSSSIGARPPSTSARATRGRSPLGSSAASRGPASRSAGPARSSRQAADDLAPAPCGGETARAAASGPRERPGRPARPRRRRTRPRARSSRSSSGSSTGSGYGHGRAAGASTGRLSSWRARLRPCAAP